MDERFAKLWEQYDSAVAAMRAQPEFSYQDELQFLKLGMQLADTQACHSQERLDGSVVMRRAQAV